MNYRGVEFDSRLHLKRNPYFGRDFFLIIFVTQNLIMSKLLAPNGKPSNLTPEQYKLVRSSNFKKWFGDWENDPENASKVIDEETKEPLVVYHGTDKMWWINNKFIFNPKLEGESSEIKRGEFGGVYFSSNINVAMTYGENILSVFLKIKNPTLIKGKNKYIQDVYDCEEKNIGCSNEDVIIKDTIDNYPNDYFFKILNNDEIDTKKYFKTDIFIVRKSNQIKLADGTNTTFDGDNPDIRFDEGGVVVGENEDYNKLPTKEEAFELIQDSIESQGTYFIDEDGDGRFESKEQAQEYVNEIYDFFYNYYSLGMIPIYRVVKTDEVDLDPYSIGESWSLDLDNAKSFGSHLGGSSKELKIISGYVPNNNVDWESAFRLFPLFSDFGDGDSEFELPVPSNNKLINIKVSDYKDAKELEPFLDKNNPNIRFDEGGEVNTGLFSQIWEWFGIKF